MDWPGGLYLTIGMQGSRSGVPAASSWYALTQTGRIKYQNQA